jgi:hypothetical protein
MIGETSAAFSRAFPRFLGAQAGGELLNIN